MARGGVDVQSLVVCVRVWVRVTNCYSNTGRHSQEWCYMYVHMLYAPTSSNPHQFHSPCLLL